MKKYLLIVYFLMGAVALFSQQFAGIGVRIQASASTGNFIITDIAAGGPAAGADIVPGDTITAVDGQSLNGLTLEETVDRIVGPEGSVVQLTLQRFGKPVTLDITRGKIHAAKFHLSANDSLNLTLYRNKLYKYCPSLLAILHDGANDFHNVVKDGEVSETYYRPAALYGNKRLRVDDDEYPTLWFTHVTYVTSTNATAIQEVIREYYHSCLQPEGYKLQEQKENKNDSYNSMLLYKGDPEDRFFSDARIEFRFSGDINHVEHYMVIKAPYRDEAWWDRKYRRGEGGKYDLEKGLCMSGDCENGTGRLLIEPEINRYEFYEGPFRDGLAHGQGQLKIYWVGYKDAGVTWSGNFTDGKPQGKVPEPGKVSQTTTTWNDLPEKEEVEAIKVKSADRHQTKVEATTTHTLESAKAGIISAMAADGFSLTYSKYGYGSASYPLNVGGFFYPPSTVQLVVLTPDNVDGQAYAYVGLNPEKYYGTQWTANVPGATVTNMKITVDSAAKLVLYGGVKWGVPHNFYLLLFEK